MAKERVMMVFGTHCGAGEAPNPSGPPLPRQLGPEVDTARKAPFPFRQNRPPDFGSYLIARSTNTWPAVHYEVFDRNARLRLQQSDTCTEHPRRSPPPPGMQEGNAPRRRIVEKHRDAVGDGDRDEETGSRCGVAVFPVENSEAVAPSRVPLDPNAVELAGDYCSTGSALALEPGPPVEDQRWGGLAQRKVEGIIGLPSTGNTRDDPEPRPPVIQLEPRAPTCHGRLGEQRITRLAGSRRQEP